MLRHEMTGVNGLVDPRALSHDDLVNTAEGQYLEARFHTVRHLVFLHLCGCRAGLKYGELDADWVVYWGVFMGPHTYVFAFGGVWRNVRLPG